MAYIDEVVEKNKRYLTQAQINALAEASRQYNAQNAANRASAQASAREQYDAGYRGLQNMGLAGAVGNVAKSGEVPRLQTQIRTPVDEYNQRLRDVENRRLDVLGDQFAQQTQAEEAARAAAQRAAAEAEQLRRAQMIAAAIASNVQTIKQAALQAGSPTREIKLNGDELEVNPRVVSKAEVNDKKETVNAGIKAQADGISRTIHEQNQINMQQMIAQAVAQVTGLVAVNNASAASAANAAQERGVKQTAKATGTPADTTTKIMFRGMTNYERAEQIRLEREGEKTTQSDKRPTGFVLNEDNVHIQKDSLNYFKAGLNGYNAEEDKQALDAAQKKVDALEEARQTNSWDVPENVYQQAVAQRNVLKLKVEDPDTYALLVVANSDSDGKTKEAWARAWVSKKFGSIDEKDAAEKLKYANQSYSRMMAEWEKSLPTDEQKQELYDDQHEQYENYKSLLDVIDDKNSTANDKARARASINAGPLNEREARAFVKKYEAFMNPQLPANVQQAKYDRDMAELRYKDPETYRAVQILQNKDILYSMAPEMVEEAAKTAAPFLMKQYGFKTPSMTDAEYNDEKKDVKQIKDLLRRINNAQYVYDNSAEAETEDIVSDKEHAGNDLKDAVRELQEKYNMTPEEADKWVEKFEIERDARSEYMYYLPGMLAQAINQGEKPEKAANKEEGNSLYRAINDLPAIYQFYEPSNEEEQDRRMVRYMTPDQKNSYNAIYERDGIDAANQYYHDIIPFLNIQRAQQDEEFARKFADEYPVLADIHSVGGNMLWNIPAAAENLLTGVRGMFTEERPYYDVNSHWSFRSARPEAIRSERSLNILSNMGRPDWVNQILNSAYQTGMSMADSAAVLPFAITGNDWAVYAIFSSSAGMSAYKDAISRGATQDQALTFGILCGAAESIFEKLSLERIIHANYTGRGALIKNLRAQAGVEGSEELATGLANFLSDLYVMRDKSEYARGVETYRSHGMSQNKAEIKALLDQAKDIGLEYVGGYISGGLFALGGAVASSIHFAKVGKQVRSNSESLKRYSDLANLLGPETQQALNEYETKKTDRSAGKMVDSVNRTINELLETQAVKESKTAQEQTGETAQETTQEVEKEAAQETGDARTEESVRDQAMDNATALAALVSGEQMNAATAESIMDVLGSEALEKMGYNTTSAPELAASYNARLDEFNIQARSGELTPRLYSRAQMRQAMERETRKLAAPSDRVWKDPNIGYVVTNEGKRVRGLPGNLTAVSEEEQKRSNYAARTTVTSGGVTYQIAGMEAREGLSNSQALSAVKNNMDKEARGKAEFYEKISKALPGISFVVHDTMGMPDGSFDAKTGAIHVSLSGNQSALRVTAHELTHLMKEEALKNPSAKQAYDALRQAIIEEIGQKMFDRMMEQKADEYTRMGDPIDLSTPEGKAKAEDETIAELCERMLSNPDFVEKFCEEHTEEAKTLMDYILKIVNAIKSALKDMGNRDFGLSWSARVAEAENVLNKWYNLLNTTLENIGTAQEGETASQEGTQAETASQEKTQMEDQANPELYADEESVRAERRNTELQKEIEAEIKKGPYPAGYSSKAVDGVISKALDVLGTKDSYSSEDYEKLRARIGQSLPVVEEWLKDPENEQKQEAANERIRQVANEIVDAYRETEGASGDLSALQQDIPNVIGVGSNQMKDILAQYDKGGLFKLQGMLSKALDRKVTLVGESNPQFKNASKMDQLFEELRDKYNLSDDQDFARDAQNLVDFIQGVRDASEGTTVTMADYGAEAREQAFLDVQTALADALTEAAGEKAGVEYSLPTDKMRDNGVRFSAGDVDALRIKDQLKNNQEKLNAMEPVVSIKSDGKQGRTSSQMRDALIEFFASRKYGVDRQGFGRVLFNADALGTMARYIKTDAEFAAVKAAPSVVRRGIQIGYESNHKGRGVESYTFAAPVILNGERGNVAVVVQVTNKNKAHCARVLMPDGSGFDLNVAEKADQEARGPEKRAQQRMKSASIDTIAESKGKSNSSERNTLDTDYLRLAEKYKSGTATEAETQQLRQAVEQAAKEAGYTKEVYHGTEATFTEFQEYAKNEIGYHVGSKKAAESRVQYALNKNVMQLYAKLGRKIQMPDVFGLWHGIYDYVCYVNGNETDMIDRDFLLNNKKATAKYKNEGVFKKNAEYETMKKKVKGMWDDAIYAHGIKPSLVAEAVKAQRDYMLSLGIDTIEYKNKYEDIGSKSYMLMHANQVKSADLVTYDDQKNIIPLSERFKQGNTDIRYSIDTDYLRLAEKYKSGTATEAETQQLRKAVERAAKDAGYSDKMYHGSRKGGGFTVFKGWQYFTPNEAYAERYAQRDNPNSMYQVYVKADNYFDTRKADAKRQFEKYRQEYGLGELQENGLPDWTDGYDLAELIEDNGLNYDGIILDEGGDMVDGKPVSRGLSYVIRDSAQIKSADPVTYDDQGNIIPLSERFKPDNPDIRWIINTDALRQNANVFTEIKPEALEKGIEQLKNLTPGKGLWALKDISRFMDTVSGGDKDLRDTLTAIFETPHRQALKNYADGVARMQQRVLDIGARAGVCDEKGRHFDSKKSAAIQNIGEGFSNTRTDLKVRIKDADAVTVKAYEPGTDKLVVSERDYTLPELRRAYGRDMADAVWTKVFDEAQKAKETGHKFTELEYGVNTRPYTLENLQSDFRNDWQQLYEAAKEFRQIYDDYIDTINRMLEQLYPNTSKYADVDKITKAIEEKEARLKTRKESEQARIDELNKKIGAKEAEMAGKRRKDTKAYRDLWDQKERLRRKVEEVEADLKEYEENIRDDLKVLGEEKAALHNAEKNGDSLSRMHRLEYREDYFHHFREMASGVQNLKAIFTSSTDISPAIVGKSDTTKPKSRFAGWMQKRTGADYTADALNGMLKYGQLAEYKLAFDPLAAYLREANDKIRNLDKNETNRDNLIRYIDQWTNTILGKSHKIDRALVDSGVGMRSKMFKTLDWINSRVIQNTLLWNMRSALIQISNVTNAKSLVPNPLHWAGGLRSWALAARGNAEMQAIMNQSTFLASRYMDSLQLTDSALKSAKEFAGWMLGALDEISAKATWWAAYTQYQKNPNAPTIKNASRSYANAIEYADDVTRRTHAGRGVGELAPAMTSRVINLVAPFQVEVNNTYQLLKDNVRQKNYWGLLSTGVSVFLMNTVFEAIVGSTPLGFDFIRAILDIVFGFAGDDDDYDLTRAGQRLAGEFVGGLPYANQIVGLIGQDYAKKIIGEDTDVTRYGNTQIGVNAIINTLSGLFDIADAVKNGRNLITETNFISDIDDLLSLIMPMGGKQLARTAEGIKTVAQGYGSKVDEEGVEKVQFITEQDLAHYLHASLFGKWSLTEASEYFGEERLLPKLFGAYEGPKSSMGKLVDAKEYKAALETGIDGKEYFSLKYDLKEYTTQPGKRAELMEHDYTPEQKANLDMLLIPDKTAEVKVDGAVVYQKSGDEWKVKADYTNQDMFDLSQKGDKTYTGTLAAIEKTSLPQDQAVLAASMWDQAKEADDSKTAFRELLRDNKNLTVAQKEALDLQYCGNKYPADYADSELFELSITNRATYEKAKQAKAQGIPVKSYVSLYDKKNEYTGEDRADYMRREIMRSNLSAKQKELLDDLLVSDNGRNPDYTSTAWFEISMLGGGQYYEAKDGEKIGLKPETYLTVYKKWKTLDAKDENGETVNGLKKKRAKEYLDSLSLSAPVYDYIWTVVFGYSK